MKAYFWFLIIAAAGGHASAQFKCTAQDGSVTLQQMPCNSTSRQDTVRVSPGNVMETPAQVLEAAGRRPDQRGLRIGMSEAELLRVMGRPDRANFGNYGGRTAHQFIYEQQGRIWYVYVREGMVSSFQNTEGFASVRGHPAPAYRAPPRVCPSRGQIRDWEAQRHSLKDPKARHLLTRHEERIADAYRCLRETGQESSFGRY